MHRVSAVLIALAIAVSPLPGVAQSVNRVNLPASHPLVGTWRIDLPGVNCHELYRFTTEGKTQVTSGQQSAESELELSLAPSPKGFYKWVDKIVKDNGKPDCMGAVMQVGHVATNYIVLHPNGDRFLLCTAEDMDTCIGPFVRQEGI